jgi:hypothetical protein
MRSTSEPARGVEEIGVMPAIAAAPGPRADRPPGVVTQVGEPLYHGNGLAMQDQSAPATQMAAGEAPRSARARSEAASLLEPAASQPVLAAGGATMAYNDRLVRAVGSMPLRGAESRLLDQKEAGDKEEVAVTAPATSAPTQPTSAPASHPTSQPASQPTSQPASQPTSQPASQPASAPASAPSRD